MNFNQENNPKGLLATRYSRSMTVARNVPQDAGAYAEGHAFWDRYKTIVTAARSAVDAVDSLHAASLMAPIGIDFVEFVRPLTILGRLPAVRRVPFRVRMVGITGGAVASFVGSGLPKPLTSLSFSAAETILEPCTVVTILPITEELARSESIIAERAMRAEMARAAVQAEDTAFIDPSNVGATGDSPVPASITSSATMIASTGKTLAAVDADLQLMIETLLASGSNLASAVWIMNPRTATHLAMLRGTGGAPAFPTVTAASATLIGLPVVVSGSTPMSADSDATTSITLLDQSGVALADGGEARISVTSQASIEMSDTPTEGAVQQVSLWQMGLACLRAERWVNWMPRRDNVAVVLTGVEY